ncbi:Zn-finger containing protein [Clostridium sediminicola]|uniref:hypothetical protein n=1 Tax=Clostridium sediminicola TaxID=3114879 RepID=UPI0031F2062C
MKNNYINGKYGLDSFSKFLLIVGVLLILTKSYFVAPVFIGYSIFRIFSKDFPKRQKEEMAYRTFVGTIKYRLGGLNYKLSKYFNKGILLKVKNQYYKAIRKVEQRKNFVVVKCPECKQKLRLPRGKGNLVVTCKMCKYEFKKRT